MIKKSYITVGVILVGIFLTVYCYYPGFMSPDSFAQLKQGRAGQFNDWHPPVMSYVWGMLDRIVPGPAGMLLLQNLLFWSGIGVLVSDLLGHRFLTWLIIAILGFFPPIFALLGTIWKDVGLGCALVFASAMYLKAQRFAPNKKGKSNFFCALAILSTFYGLTMRHNAIAAVVPILIWAAWILTTANFKNLPDQFKLGAIFAIALLFTLLLSMSMIGINNYLIKGRHRYPIQQILVHDLVAISLDNNKVLLPDYLEAISPPITLSDLRKSYLVESAVYMFVGDPSTIRPLPLVEEKSKVDELMARWLRIIPQYPKSYLAHRWSVFKSLTGIGRTMVYYPFHWGVQPNELGLSFHPRRANDLVLRGLSQVKDTVLFRAWFYLSIILLALLSLPFMIPKRFISVYTIGLSGLCYELAYFFVATAADFRMNWWTVCATAIMVLLALFDSPTRTSASV